MKNLFYPYLLGQYPDPSRFSDVLDLTLKYADVVEIGIPFSDPVADGPVIATAAAKVLTKPFSIDSLFKLLESKRASVPLAMMSYANPVLAYGREEFLKASAAYGAKFLIVPDVPFEESSEWRTIAKEYGLAWISFVSLLTSQERLKRIAEAAEGFLYLLSLSGVTGASIHGHEQIRQKALQLKQITRVPVALGFGIKSAEDTRKYEDVVDAFIVGSRIIEIIDSGQLKDLEAFYKSFKRF